MRSMRIFLLLSCNALMLLEAYKLTTETDRKVLLEFKSQISQDKRLVLSSWNQSFPICSWNGVTCGRRHKRVTGMNLEGLQLGGVISPYIGNLSFLISLNLKNNSLGGNIPHELGNLFRLEHLSISFNFLEGEIPSSLYNCSRLQTLSLFQNQLGGSVPSELGSLTKLVTLYLGRNNLKGKLPASLGNLTSLEYLSLGDNNIEGEVPHDIARLTQMVYFGLSINKFSGAFPPAIYNFSSLEFLYLFRNGFSGSLRHDFGNVLPKLREVYMGKNFLTGAIPTTLPNISNLQELGMDGNNLTGSIPPSFGKVRNLQYLVLGGNYLGSYSFGDLEFISALTNCSQLDTLRVGDNRLGGDLPTSIANLSTNLIYLSLEANLISGSIPHDIGNLIRLQRLELGGNMLTGSLPTSLGRLSDLGVISLSSNRMSGEIPSSVGNITRLIELDLSNNSFEGTIPRSLGKCNYLLHMLIEYNKLNGTIPREIMQLSTLLSLNIGHNSLSGSLPEDVGQLQNIVTVSLGNNKLSGKIPPALGNCLVMEEIYLQGNSFDGAIPNISGLVGVKKIDLSHNNLSGSIPGYFANFSKLQYLNLSINSLEGKVPSDGIFQNVFIVSVFRNKDLCGGIREMQLKACFEKGSPLGTNQKKVVIGVSVGITLLLLLFIALASLIWFRKRKKNQQTTSPAPSTLEVIHEKIGYGDLRNAKDGFSSNNKVGSGSFGTVYKALLPAENKVVAVKVLNMQRRGAMKSFLAECKSLKDIRHRNLVKLFTACSSIDFQGNEFRALIYEFMPNGSLDMWLHPKDVKDTCRPSRTLTLFERLNIAIDLASVLDYLHVQCHEAIAHCDLKPSNVLLDDDLIAHVSDFGLARLLLKFDKECFLNQLSSAGVRGTIGYAAPEYGIGGEPSIHGDVYSFRVLLLEMFTGRRPTNELFGGELTLQSYTNSALPERVLDIADKFILLTGLKVGFPAAECLKVLLELGLRCCEESPTNRLSASEATKELIFVRQRFFKTTKSTKH